MCGEWYLSKVVEVQALLGPVDERLPPLLRPHLLLVHFVRNTHRSVESKRTPWKTAKETRINSLAMI
jgi:hypothetical protein